jgi:hypothetical protein
VPTLDKALVLEMGTCAFITAKENWLLCGPTGVGKSHLATAIGYEAIRRGMKALSFATHRLLAARADGSHHKLLTRLTAVELLIIDDFGLRPISPQGAEDLYELIARRYEHGSILLTSNRSPAEWAEVFGDALLASGRLRRPHPPRTGDGDHRRKLPPTPSQKGAEASRETNVETVIVDHCSRRSSITIWVVHTPEHGWYTWGGD